jgi:hypothetical protein
VQIEMRCISKGEVMNVADLLRLARESKAIDLFDAL